MFYFKPITFKILTCLLMAGGLGVSVVMAARTPSDQVVQNSTKAISEFPSNGGGHTLSYNAVKTENGFMKEFNDKIINGEKTPPAIKNKGQTLLKNLKKIDEGCAVAAEGQQQTCIQQRNGVVAQMEAMVGANNPNLEILLSQQAAPLVEGMKGEFDPASFASAFDDVFAQLGNLQDMFSKMGNLPTGQGKQDLQTPLPSGPNNSIYQVTDINELKDKRLASADIGAVSNEPEQGFMDSIKNWFQKLKPSAQALQNALVIQVWAQAPFGSFGQTGQSQLASINASRSVAGYNRQSKTATDARDKAITQHNDISGQGAAAFQERLTKTLETMNETTQEQTKALKAVENICQRQRASEPCWENGNDIPWDLLALLMGAVGGGGGEAESKPVDVKPYSVWLHCPLQDQPFRRDAEGVRMSGLLLEEKSRLLLTLKSKLPERGHSEGCIVALPGQSQWEYFSATIEPEVIEENGGRVQTDLVLLKINTAHSEDGEVLGDVELKVDDFITHYWPNHLAQCVTNPHFKLGDEIKLYGFEPLEEEAMEPAEVAEINGLTDFVAEQDGSVTFTTNGEESFNGALVTRETTGCFKGFASIEVNETEKTNTQTLLPISQIQAWLPTQNIVLPSLQNKAALNQND